MQLFSRKRGHQPLTGGLAAKVAGLWLVFQGQVAGWLNDRTIGYSTSRWLMLLVFFCLLAGSACIYLIISSIY
ncbi:hypothetical protein [Pedobacter psychroterrae]|uniref:Uncharacterized protein n=1 Tax=Pedobacter psychroterrae TaxID=2530453 RepID=A0A4R0NVW0_9SPHI|nr:hypothetical protein [Pedobacter psychroterrae]TCD03174.1 hypothetical protein EZ437_04155 [Pedobacter psychroterrae]